jgi:hypothetical protein
MKASIAEKLVHQTWLNLLPESEERDRMPKCSFAVLFASYVVDRITLLIGIRSKRKIEAAIWVHSELLIERVKHELGSLIVGWVAAISEVLLDLAMPNYGQSPSNHFQTS